MSELLNRRYGEPQPDPTDQQGLLAHRRLDRDDPRSSVLFVVEEQSTQRPAVLDPIYGDAHAASLIGGSLKVATCGPPEVYGLYDLDEYPQLPELESALTGLADAVFFMDASNVHYYAVYQDRIIEFDVDAAELSDRGPIERAFDVILGEWEAASGS